MLRGALVAVGLLVLTPASSLAASPASFSLTSAGGGKLSLSVTMGEASSDYVALELGSSPHPAGYYQISNISGPVDISGAQDCKTAQAGSALECSTGQPVGSSLSVSFTVTPQYPNETLTALSIGYPDNAAEGDQFCAPGSNKLIERKIYDTNRQVVSDTKTGASCTQLGVAGVRFAPRGQSDPATAGLPVVWDRVDQVTTEAQQAATLNCPGIQLDPAQFDYLDCDTNPVPSGKTTLDWPVIVHSGDDGLTLDEADLYAPLNLPNATLSATATLGGAMLTLPQASVKQTQVGNGWKLASTAPLKFTGTIPAGAVGRQTLQIDWKLTSDAGTITATSSHTVYVTASRYAQPQAHSRDAKPSTDTQPYLSILDLGSTAAAGISDPAAAAKAIWQRFATRQVPEVTLNPANGQVTPTGIIFDYYTNDYHSEANYFNSSQGCPTLQAFLTTPDDGHCGDWSWFLEQILAYQGVPSSEVLVGEEPDFDAGPAPFGLNPLKYSYMLIHPWALGGTSLPDTLNGGIANPFTVANRLTSAGSQIATSADHIRFNTGADAIGQGLTTYPLGMFQVGDHRLVYVPAAGGYFDPSYGNPRATTPYPTVRDWENASVDGFAVVYAGRYLNRRATVPLVNPLPYYTGPTLAGICRRLRCWFAAAARAGNRAPASAGPPTPTGSSASFNAACESSAKECTINGEMIDFIISREGKIIGTEQAVHRTVRKRTLLGRVTVRLKGGATRRVTIRLNAIGRKLLRRFHRLPSMLTVTSGRHVLERIKLTLRHR